MKKLLKSLFVVSLLFFFTGLYAEDGYRLWLRYDAVTDQKVLKEYGRIIKGWVVEGDSPVLAVAKRSCRQALTGCWEKVFRKCLHLPGKVSFWPVLRMVLRSLLL
jgi:alpha-glucuronidase